MNPKPLILLFSLLLLVTSGCRTLEPTTWQLDSTVNNTVDWDTNKDQNAPVLSLNCVDEFGAHHLLSGLKGFKEPSSNLDRFIASLDIDCIKHIEFGGKYVQDPNAEVNTTTLTTELNFRTTSGEQSIAVEPLQYPVGLMVSHNRKNYISNLQFIFVTEEQGILTDYLDPGSTTSTITDYPDGNGFRLWGTSPKGVNLICGSQQVLTGLRIRPDPSNGKIRMIGLDCQVLRRDESATGED
ncbi:MAG: hypothetical protein AB8G77_17675 [Rhodothermales bacterium]